MRGQRGGGLCLGRSGAARLFRPEDDAPTGAHLRRIPFLALSAARRALDQPRPFELYDLEPLLPRETPGRSFPSRHVFSICVIGTCFCWLRPWVGFTLLGLGAVLAALRVISAVHFPRDVLAGAAVGIASGVIGFGLL